LRRGFLHRFTVVAFALGLMVLPYLQFIKSGTVYRAGLEAEVGIANPNQLAAWLGFCCVYFAVLGIETRLLTIRLLSCAVVVVALLIVGLTVSRGSLGAIVVAV